MPEPPDARPSTASTGDVPAAVKAQILATEHWSLLATRTLAWNESFSRASWFLTVVSATVVALALVAQATQFGGSFRFFALLILPVVVVVGLATFVRLVDLNNEDVGLVAGMNRLRGGYLDISPELAPYFVTGHHDDLAGIMRTYGAGSMTRIPLAQYLSSIALLIGMIDAVLIGALAGLASAALGAGLVGAIGLGVTGVLLTLAALVLVVVRQVRRTWYARDSRT